MKTENGSADPINACELVPVHLARLWVQLCTAAKRKSTDFSDLNLKKINLINT
jgi:hypothetical protein